MVQSVTIFIIQHTFGESQIKVSKRIKVIVDTGNQ